jgi:hypothetical protein
VSAFADPDIIKMAQEDFIAVTGDDWYQRRRQDKEGEFFRSVADSLGKRGENGNTRQGIYCFAADGTPLAYKNAGQNAQVMKEVLQDALFKFDRLPEAKRKAGAVTVEDHGRPDPRYSRTPPTGGLIVKAYTRILDYKNDAYCKGACKTTGGDKAARDHLWLTADEVKSLVPEKAEAGFKYALAPKVAERITRYHLVDNTRGEPFHWTKQEVRSKRFTLTVVSATADAIELRLEGEAVVATDADVEKADRGYEARLLGNLRYVPAKKTFARFDVTAIGTHWGETALTRGAREGKTLLGVSFELAGDKPGDRVPPQGIRNLDDYYGR